MSAVVEEITSSQAAVHYLDKAWGELDHDPRAFLQACFSKLKSEGQLVQDVDTLVDSIVKRESPAPAQAAQPALDATREVTRQMN